MFIYVNKTTKEVECVAEKNILNIENTDVIEFNGKIPKNPTMYLFINYEFIRNNTKELIQLQQTKIAEIKASFNNSLKQGYICPTSGIKMDATIDKIGTLNSGYTLANVSGVTTMDIRDYDNIVHNGIAIGDVQTMLLELGQNYQAQLAKKWQLEEQVKNATTQAELDAIVW